MKLHKIQITTTAFALVAFSTFAIAGGINTNTNQSIHFQRSVARDASTDVDAPYANPSGTAFMEDGLYVSVNNQTFWQKRGTKMNKSPLFKEATQYEGKTFVPSMPSVLATWHRSNFALSGHLGIIGGGGSVKFNDGIPSFIALMNSSLKNIENGLTEKGLKTTKSSVDISLDASSYIFGATIGAAYEIKKMFSVYAGARLNYALNSYDGSIGNLKINPIISSINPNGVMMESSKLSETFAALAKNAKTEEEKTQFATLSKTFESLDEKTSMELDVEQTGWGITPILGLGFKYKRLTLGTKFEYNTSIEMKNKTKKNETPLSQFDDKKKDNNDIPTLITAGLTYAILDNARLSVGYHHWFDSKADFSGELEDYIDDTNEFLFGVEIDFLKRFTMSGGVQVTRYGLSDEYLSDMNINLDATSFGFGVSCWATEWMRLNLSYFHSLYNDYEEILEYGNATYNRYSRGIGLGVDFKI